MAFEFPLPIARFPAFIALCRPRRRVMAMLVVACVCSSLARADATVDAGSRGGSTLERNVWEQLEDWFADTPAPARPLRFGIACAHPPQLFVVPAELAGPVAGLMPAPPNTCDSLNDASIDTSGLAHAGVNGGPQVVMLLRELPWEMGYPGTADQNAAGASAIAAAAGSSSQVDRLKETPEPPVTSLSGCSSGQLAKKDQRSRPRMASKGSLRCSQQQTFRQTAFEHRPYSASCCGQSSSLFSQLVLAGASKGGFGTTGPCCARRVQGFVAANFMLSINPSLA